MPELPSLDELMSAAVSGVGGVPRPGQAKMAQAVEHAIETGEHLLVQAGTGTGKSLAYLVPAIRHAFDVNKPAVVATATLALQAQIVDRDLPRITAHPSQLNQVWTNLLDNATRHSPAGGAVVVRGDIATRLADSFRTALDLASPRVALLNIGTEDMKGTDEIRDAAALLRAAELVEEGF